MKIATWNMDHWKGRGRDRDHNAKAWAYTEDLGADIVLLQEAFPPPDDFDATVFPPRTELARWDSGGRAKFGTAIAVFGHAAEEIAVGPLGGDRSDRLTQTHPAAFTAARVTVGEHSVVAISLYGMFEGPLCDGVTYSVTTLHRSLSDLTPLLERRSAMTVLGGDLNVSTQIAPPDRAAHDVVFRRIDAFGMIDCTRETATTPPSLKNCPCGLGAGCVHVQTHRHPKSSTPWQNDYLFVSRKTLGSRLVGCTVRDEDQKWDLSDHWPVVVELRL